MAHPRRWLLACLVLLIVSAVTAWIWGLSLGVDAERLAAWIHGLGVWAPVGFVLLYAIASVAMIPGGFFDLAGGALFGPFFGSALDLLGGSLGAALAFLVARYLSADWVERRAGPRLQAVIRGVDGEGWRSVAFLRLVPVFPYNIVNYLLGLTRIPFHHYFIATLVFMAPSTVAYTWIGYAGRELMQGDVGKIRYALVALGLLGALVLLPRFIKIFRKN